MACFAKPPYAEPFTHLTRLQLEAISEFDADEKEVALSVLEGLILKHQAKRSMQRLQPKTKKAS